MINKVGVSFDTKAFLELEALRRDTTTETLLDEIVKEYRDKHKEELEKYWDFEDEK